MLIILKNNLNLKHINVLVEKKVTVSEKAQKASYLGVFRNIIYNLEKNCIVGENLIIAGKIIVSKM